MNNVQWTVYIHNGDKINNGIEIYIHVHVYTMEKRYTMYIYNGEEVYNVHIQ